MRLARAVTVTAHHDQAANNNEAYAYNAGAQREAALAVLRGISFELYNQFNPTSNPNISVDCNAMRGSNVAFVQAEMDNGPGKRIEACKVIVLLGDENNRSIKMIVQRAFEDNRKASFALDDVGIGKMRQEILQHFGTMKAPALTQQ